ncbi:SpoIIE family protein phosphatase [Streptomyces spongiae]|uniref:SpoIIE family protein phosphatase n=1 Tax=Streptomyces spongiae TaxID=565072 RepID=A0A5N8X9C9_9ACTN|nr:SpoIIE family protein phosphatase [Streptomyces spongiae]MPY55724.1 SpoIIE family protein phosphatase [Streptomyces spongiae]
MTFSASPRRLPPVSASTFIDTAAALVVADPSGNVTCWSAGAQSLWGYEPPEILGRPLTDLFAADGPRLRDHAGRALQAEARLYPLSADDRPVGYLLMVQPAAGADPVDDELTRWLFDQYPSPLAVYGPDARVRRMNTAACRAIALGEDEVRGRLITEFLEGPAFALVHERLVRVAESGEPEYMENFVRTAGVPRAHAWALDVFPLKNSDGGVQAVGLSIIDYSEQYDIRERLALLSEARSRIGGQLDVPGTAQELAELAVPRFADAVSVELLEPVFRGDLPGPLLSGSVQLREAAFRTVAGTLPNGPPPGRTALHRRSSPVARCLITGRAELHAVSAEDAAPWKEPSRSEPASGTGAHSLIAVPIRARGTVLGAVVFLRYAALRPLFDAGDLAVTEDLVARAAVCLDNARRFTRERGIALALQRQLLPHGSPTHPAVETAARYLPAGGDAEVGGDWFDVIPLPGARVGLVVGDVVGHGIHASATMGRLRTAVRTLADIDLPPDELLTHLDDIVTHAADDALADADATVTERVSGDLGASCLYAVYDPVAGICALARAGHPPPVLLTPDGMARVLDVPAGPPLGLGSLPFEAGEFRIPEGSLLALFTDGLIETRGTDVDERLGALCRALEARPTGSAETQCDSVLDALHTDSRDDDIALLLARTKVLDRDHVASWELTRDPAAVAETRREVGERLAEWGLEEVAFTTELVVSELVTNAIRYATVPIQLRLIRQGTLICEISDGSSTSPHLRRARLSDEGGRGLFLVAELSHRWGTRYTSTGKTIWAEQSVDSRGSVSR